MSRKHDNTKLDHIRNRSRSNPHVRYWNSPINQCRVQQIKGTLFNTDK